MNVLPPLGTIRFDNNTDSNIPNLADVLLLYYNPCLAGWQDRDKAWKPFRATARVCLQTLNTTFKSSTTTSTVLDSTSTLNWTVTNSSKYFAAEQYCVEYREEQFCIARESLQLWSGQIALTLNTSGSLVPGSDDYYYTGLTVGLVHDVLGDSLSSCTNETGRGFEGFTSRMQSVGISTTNA